MSKVKNRVLIVDDEETLTWGMSKSLSKARSNLEILSANSGEEALSILEKTPVDIVITDIRMPGMNGLKLLSKTKSIYPSVDVIVMTAYGSSQVQQEAVTSGSLYYIEKPFEIEEMEELIDKALKKRPPHKGALKDKPNNLQLTDIIQINCLGKLTCALKVSQAREEGEIYFQGGEIIHSQCGELTGEEAFFKILGWQNGKFETRDQFTTPPKTIDSDWQSLLLRGSQVLDENMKGEAIRYEDGNPTEVPHLEESKIAGVNHRMKGTSPSEPPPPPSPTPGPTLEETPPSEPSSQETSQRKGKTRYADLSYELKGLKGIRGAVIVAKDGVVLGSSIEGPDSSRLTDLWGATSLYLGGAISQVSDLLGLNGLRSGWVQVQDGQVLIMEGRCLYLGLLLEEGTQKEKLETEVKNILKDE